MYVFCFWRRNKKKTKTKTHLYKICYKDMFHQRASMCVCVVVKDFCCVLQFFCLFYCSCSFGGLQMPKKETLTYTHTYIENVVSYQVRSDYLAKQSETTNISYNRIIQKLS